MSLLSIVSGKCNHVALKIYFFANMCLIIYNRAIERTAQTSKFYGVREFEVQFLLVTIHRM